VELTCPKCAGRLSVSSDQNKLTCGSCGSELLIVRDDKTVTLRLGPQEQQFLSALAPPASPPEKICPACGRIDQVQSVSALVGAHSAAGGYAPDTVQKLSLTLPSEADPKILKLGVLLFCAGLFFGLSSLMFSSTTCLVLFLLGCASFAACIGAYSRQKRQYRRALGLREKVKPHWRTLNYCHRCDRVFSPGANAVMTPDEMEHRLYAEVMRA